MYSKSSDPQKKVESNEALLLFYTHFRLWRIGAVYLLFSPFHISICEFCYVGVLL